MKQQTIFKCQFSRFIATSAMLAALGSPNLHAAELKDYLPFGNSKPTQAPAATPQAAPANPAALNPAPAKHVAAPSTGSDEVIAKVGAAELKEADIRGYLAALPPADRAALTQDPAALSQFVRVLLVNQIVLKQALDKHWDQQPDNATLLRRVRDGAVIEAYLQSVSKPADDFPNDADVQKVYDANKSLLVVPRQYRLAQIYLTVPKDADQPTKDKVEQKAKQLSESLKQPGADFAAIAKASSDAKETAKRGGEIGWVAESQLRGEIKTLVLALSKGGTTDPIYVDDGWQIVKLLDEKDARTQTFAEARDALAQQMREQLMAANRRAFIAGLQKQDPPVINELALAKLFSNKTASQPAAATASASQ